MKFYEVYCIFFLGSQSFFSGVFLQEEQRKEYIDC